MATVAHLDTTGRNWFYYLWPQPSRITSSLFGVETDVGGTLSSQEDLHWNRDCRNQNQTVRTPCFKTGEVHPVSTHTRIYSSACLANSSPVQLLAYHESLLGHSVQEMGIDIPKRKLILSTGGHAENKVSGAACPQQGSQRALDSGVRRTLRHC